MACFFVVLPKMFDNIDDRTTFHQTFCYLFNTVNSTFLKSNCDSRHFWDQKLNWISASIQCCLLVWNQELTFKRKHNVLKIPLCFQTTRYIGQKQLPCWTGTLHLFWNPPGFDVIKENYHSMTTFPWNKLLLNNIITWLATSYKSALFQPRVDMQRKKQQKRQKTAYLTSPRVMCQHNSCELFLE